GILIPIPFDANVPPASWQSDLQGSGTEILNDFREREVAARKRFVSARVARARPFKLPRVSDELPNPRVTVAQPDSAGLALDRAGTRPIDPWRLSKTQWRPDAAALDETLFALSNGSIGVRGGIEESVSASQASFVANVWERTPIEYHERHV